MQLLHCEKTAGEDQPQPAPGQPEGSGKILSAEPDCLGPDAAGAEAGPTERPRRTGSLKNP